MARIMSVRGRTDNPPLVRHTDILPFGFAAASHLR